MNALPVRLFHASLLGMSLGVFAVAGYFHFAQNARAEWGGVGGMSTPVVITPNVTSTDDDGDGMPNTWESANLLGTGNPADALSDFDGDGLTALQECQLNSATSGQYGTHLGKWSASTIPRPTGFITTPSVTLIECASNGTILARVQGRLTITNINTSYPYTYSPATGLWTRIAAPDGFPSVTSLTPLDVNASGQVVGYFNSSGTKGFLWTPNASGGQTVVFNLNTTSGLVAAIPKRISDTGYMVGDVGSLGGRSFAATSNGNEFVLPGQWTSLRYFDVNDYGEFVGYVYNPFANGTEVFLATVDGYVYMTGIERSPEMEDLIYQDSESYWYLAEDDVPDINPDAITWIDYPSGYQGHRAGTAVDRKTGGTVDVHEGDGAEFYWHSDLLGSSSGWFSYPGYSSTPGGINDWGEFSGNYSGSIRRTIFSFYQDYYTGETYAYQGYDESLSRSGIYFFDGSYYFSSARPSIYGVSNDPRVLIGTPYAIWSGSLTVPIANLMPAGNPTTFNFARLSDGGKVLLQQSASTLIYVLKSDQDVDGDGMPDDWEKFYLLDPNNGTDASEDSDEDGTCNLAEFQLRTDPKNPPGAPPSVDLRPGIDTDGDGMPNVWEWKYGLNYNDASDANGDLDGDGLGNLQEYILGILPGNPDMDGDGLPDGWEVQYGFDPLDNGSVLPKNGGSGDNDGDGVSNRDEYAAGGNPNNSNDFPIQIIQISNSASGYQQEAAPWDEREYLGICWYQNWNEEYFEESVDDQPLTPEFLTNLIKGGGSNQAFNFPELPTQAGSNNPNVIRENLKNSKITLAASHSLDADEEFQEGSASISRIWLRAPASTIARKFILLKAISKTVWPHGNQDPVDPELVSLEKIEITVPASAEYSTPIDVECTPETTAGNWTDWHVYLVPLEEAPAVLPVNSDFDEGRIDPATGYAIPDCDDEPNVNLETGAGNSLLELDAARNHLDGKHVTGDDVTEDLHKGWFGALPSGLPNELWDGAMVTIQKIEKEDVETGRNESGQVRFYAKWNGGYYGIVPYDLQSLTPNNLATGGVNLRPGEGVYGSTSTIPMGAQFWMEGLRPGKITLEWRIQKGNFDVRHEQTFRVETQKSSSEWKEEARYQIRLQTLVNPRNFGLLSTPPTGCDVARMVPSNGFTWNREYIRQFYYYYRQFYSERPEVFMWAGMAKVAGAEIYAGMSEMELWVEMQKIPGSLLPADPGSVYFLNDFLITGARGIFEDMAWAHHAYAASGIWAINHVATTEGATSVDPDAWQKLDDGISSNDQIQINSSARRLLEREQSFVMQPYYTVAGAKSIKPPIGSTWVGAVPVPLDPFGLANLGEWMSANSTKNPIPGGLALRTVVPGGRLDVYVDRWQWIDDAREGMLHIWIGDATGGVNMNAANRAGHNALSLKVAALPYTHTGGVTIPPEP